MDKLKKYIIEGRIQDKLISEMNESYNPVTIEEENEYMKHKASKLVEGILKEFEMAMADDSPQQEDPYKNVDPKVRKSQGLVRLLQDNLWKMCDMDKKTSDQNDEELDADIKALMISNIEPLVKATINKLHSIWFGDSLPKQKEKEEENEEPVTIIIGQDVITPQQESFKIKQITGEKIMLENINGICKIVDKSILLKWIKE